MRAIGCQQLIDSATADFENSAPAGSTDVPALCAGFALTSPKVITYLTYLTGQLLERRRRGIE